MPSNDSKNTKPEPTSQPQPKPKRRLIQKLSLSGESCKPSLGLMERIAHTHKPSPEDLAILDAWRFRFNPVAPKKN